MPHSNPMTFYKKHKASLSILLALAVVGQIAFFFYSPGYTKPVFENSMFATIGYTFDGRGDLHLLNDAAHYFGQTMIGWSRFPNFHDELTQAAELPAETLINLHMQERQNILMTLTASFPIDPSQLVRAKNFLQGKLNEYNKATNTSFTLTNVDYELAEIHHSYGTGALFALILSLALGGAYLFLKKEFFPPRLKL